MAVREIVYYDVSPFAALSANETAANVAEFSDTSKLFKENQIFRSIQTCEKNYTVLDGTHCGFAGDGGDGDNGNNMNNGSENIALWNTKQSLFPSKNLPEAVMLDIRFGGLQSSPGIAFYFDYNNNVYCEWLNVKWYRNSTVIDDKDFYPDSAIYSCIHKIDFYDRVQVTFYRLNMPYRYLKAEAVIFGIVRFFADDSLESLTINEGTDPTGRSIYINTAKFTINTKDPVPYLFLKRQPVHIRYNGALIGTYYVDKSKKYADKHYNVEAIDKIGVLDNTDEFLGGMYQDAPAGDIIREIIGGLFDVTVDESLEYIPVSGWLPIAKKRTSLAQVALAIGAVIDASRTGAIKVRAMPRQLSKIIGKDRVYTSSSVDIAFPYTGIELIEYNYTAGTETKELFKDTFNGEKMIKFSEPVSNITILNGMILERDVNFARISSDGSAECVLKGRPYIENKNSVIIKTELVIEGTQEKIEKIENGYLINKNISRAVAERLYNYYMRQNTFNGDILLDKKDTEKIGDIVTVATCFEDDITGQIEKLSLNLGYKNIKARGVIRGN